MSSPAPQQPPLGFPSSYTTVYDGVLGPWFIDVFAVEAGLSALDYAILLRPVEICVDRVHSREGHGFTDEAATRKMYDEFSGASVADRHLVRVTLDGPDAVADLARA